jgi:hypothetical protein
LVELGDTHCCVEASETACLGIVSKGCFANTCHHVACCIRIQMLGSPSQQPIGAVCGSAARTDLAGGRWVTIVPTGTGQPGMMGRNMMQSGMGRMPTMGMRGHMMKFMFAIVDVDGDCALSFEEVTTVHKRIFNRVDANKDGKVTPEEVQTFMRD